MKLINKIFFLVGASLMFAACTKKFEELNTDPNGASAANYPPVYNLTKSQLEYTGNSDFSYEVWRVNIIYCGMFTQHLANASWYAGDKYMQNDACANAYFDVAYKDQVKYVVDLLALTKDKPNYKNLYQIARIMKVMIFHRITDLYGEIPYTEAGLGFYGRIFTPKYDKQQSIYLDMLKELDEAGTALDVSADKPGTGDLIYGATAAPAAQWKKLANSLMIRLGMRLTKVDPAAAKTWVEKGYAKGPMTSNADNALVKHDATGGRQTVNLNSNILGDDGEWKACKNGEVYLSRTFVNYLKTNNDPRLQYLSRVRSSGSTVPALQIGLPNGYDQNGGATDVSTAPGFPGNISNYSTIRSDIFLTNAGPTVLATYGQQELLLAEAAKRGWSVGAGAATHYNNGVTAAMEQFVQYNASAAIAGVDITAYLTAHPYADSYDQINSQYRLASFLDWYETWSNWRRSGYPALTPVNYVGNATGGQIPRRMLYPSSEASANGTNYDAAISSQGTNTFMTRVWWDKP